MQAEKGFLPRPANTQDADRVVELTKVGQGHGAVVELTKVGPGAAGQQAADGRAVSAQVQAKE